MLVPSTLGLFHYMFIAIIAYYINIYAKGTPAIVCYMAVSVSAFVGSFITFEIIRRIPVIRFFVLGMKRKK